MMERRMKDSGIPWIGMIPEDWEVCRHKDIFSCSKDLVGSDWNLTQLLSLTTKGIKSINPTEQTGKVPDSYETYQIVEPNSIVMCLFDLDCSAVFAGISPIKGMISPAYKVLTTFQSIHPKYIDYYFQFIFNGRKFMYLSKNIRYSLTYDEFSMIRISIPPFSEQEKIASWLDERCGEIDELIEVEQKMIETLETYRQATITETVTRGLNPDVPMRQSKIDQLDEIPNHWDESRLLKIVYLRARLGWRGLKSDEYVDEGYPFLSAFNIIGNKLDWSETNYINQFRYDESPEIKLSIGDVLLVKDGAGIGKCAHVDDLPKGESTVNSSLGVITVSNKLNSKYLYFYFLSHLFQELTERLRNGMGVPHLTQESMKSLVIPLPPIEEQCAIADYLDIKCKDIDELIAVKREKIETLKQYRQSIIFEAVTGKLNI